MVSSVIEKSTNKERFVTLAGRLPQEFNDQDIAVVVKLRGQAQDINAVMSHWNIYAEHPQTAYDTQGDCVIDGVVNVGSL